MKLWFRNHGLIFQAFAPNADAARYVAGGANARVLLCGLITFTVVVVMW